MRRLAQVIAGVLALAFMLMYVPWQYGLCSAASCFDDPAMSLGSYMILSILMQTLVYAIVATLVLVGVLGMRDVGAAPGAAVLAALGQSRQSAVRDATRRGVLDATVAIGLGFAVTAACHVWLVLGSEAPFNAVGFMWIARALVGAVFAAALVGAHVINAMRPRKSPVDQVYEGAAAPAERRFGLRARALVLGAIAAAAAGVVAGVALAHNPAEGAASPTTFTVVQGAQITLWIALLAAAFAIATPLALTVLRPALVGASRALRALKATRAAAIVHARAATASGASHRTFLAVFGLALIAGALAYTNPAPSLTPAYVGAITMVTQRGGEEVADEYRAIEGVGAVIVAPVIEGDYKRVLVDVDEVAAVDPVLTDLLTSHPGALVSSNSGYGESIYGLGNVGINATGIVPISTCCVSFIESEWVAAEVRGTALLVYAADSADPAEVAQRVSDYVPTSSEVWGYGNSMAYSTNEYWSSWFAYVYFGIVALVCAGPIFALAVGVARRRRRDDATLAALGASQRTLRGAAVVETTVLASVAVAAGLLSGAVIQASMGVIARAEDSLDGVITDSYLEVAVRSVDWGNLAVIFGVAVAIFAGVAWIVSVSARAQLPAESLRNVNAGGIG